MRKHLKKYFIPHSENEYKPHLLRETAVTILALIALAVFVFSSIHTALLVSSSDFLAAVLPRVLVDLTNNDRGENTLAPLTISPVLESAAQLKANDMAENSYFAHVSPDGVTPWHWFVEAGYQFVAAGENLAVNFSDSEDVEQAWMDSVGHRANILNGNFTEIGIATARGQYKGRETVFVVQLFGRPALAQATPVPDAVAKTPASTIDNTEPIPAVAAGSVEAPETSLEIVEVAKSVVEDASDSAVSSLEEPDTLEVIREDNMFIAVRDTAAMDAEEEVTQELAGTEAVGLLAPEQTNFVERLFAQPRTLLNIAYFILAVLVLISLILNIVIEIKHQHPRHIAYGVLLFVLIVGFAYIYRNFIFAELFII